jgi:hypothetical protein
MELFRLRGKTHAKGHPGVPEKGKRAWRDSEKESKLHRGREKDKMSNTMKVSDRPTETFIFLTDRNMVKVVMDFNRRMCTVYSDKGKVLLKMEKMTTIGMNVLKNRINRYIASKKNSPYNMYRGMGII